jgi:hypothetical protein
MPDYNAAERRQARKDGVSVVKNSGRHMNKGDAKNDELLIDYKFTEGKSYSLNLEKFTKHEKDAIRIGRIGVVVAVFTTHRDRSIAMIDWDILQEILKEKSE